MFSPDGIVQYDFSSEPRPYKPRHCSFFATSVYFVILAILTILEEIGVYVPESKELGDGIIGYIERNLLEAPGVFPCIRPNEGTEELLRNILPHVGESIAFRGACLADWVLYKAKANEKEGHLN
jgi:hypothetical protein